MKTKKTGQTYFLWRAHREDGYCLILPPEGVEKSYQLNRGIARLENWPPNIICRMNPDYPKDIQLSDNLKGTSVNVISKSIKDTLIEVGAKNVEFLPISIINHKGRVASKDYFIMNPLTVIDCINIEESEVKWNPIREGQIDACERLVLKEEEIPKEVILMRPKYLTYEVLIRNDIVDLLNCKGFLGLEFKDPLDYTGI